MLLKKFNKKDDVFWGYVLIFLTILEIFISIVVKNFVNYDFISRSKDSSFLQLIILNVLFLIIFKCYYISIITNIFLIISTKYIECINLFGNNYFLYMIRRLIFILFIILEMKRIKKLKVKNAR